MGYFKKILVYSVLLFVYLSAKAQTNIISSGTDSLIFNTAGSKNMVLSPSGALRLGGIEAINSAALLQMNSSTRGLLISRMTTSQRDAISSPPTGLLIFNLSTNRFNFYDGSSWQVLLPDLGSSSSWALSGNSGTTASNFVGTTDNVSLRFRTNNVNRVIIDSLGRVGVNQISPQAYVDILNTSNSINLLKVANTNTSLGMSVVEIQTNGNGPALNVSQTGNGMGIISTVSGTSKAGEFINNNTTTGTSVLSVVAMGNGNKALEIAHTGSQPGSTDFGIHSNVSGGGANNVAGYFRATGATNNYALQLGGSASGTLSISPAPTTTSYAIVMPSAQGTANTYLRNDGTGILTWASLPSDSWSLGGNSGTLPSNFLGTIDNVSLRFRTNNINRLILDSLGRLGLNNGLTYNDANFSVYRSTDGMAVASEILNNTGNNIAIYGKARQGDVNVGVLGVSQSSTVSDTAYGIMGQINLSGNALGAAVTGMVQSSGASGSAVAVQGLIDGENAATKAGFYASVKNTSATPSQNYGALLNVESKNGTTNYGVYSNVSKMGAESGGRYYGGVFNASGNGINDTTFGIFASALSAKQNFAAYFASGNVYVQDTVILNHNVLKIPPTVSGGNVLTADGSGKAVWQSLPTPPSSWILSGNTDVTGTSAIGSVNNASLRFKTNNNIRMYIDSATGNVSIGSTTPASSRLDVNGTTRSTIFQARSSSVDLYPVGFTATNALRVYGNDGVSAWRERLRVTGLGTIYGGYALSGLTPLTMHISADKVSPYDSSLVLHDNGWVGIGRVDPTNKLTVAGTNVSNSAIAVESYTTTTTIAPVVNFRKSQSTSIGGHIAVLNNETLGGIRAYGSDGSSFLEAAGIWMVADAAPSGSNLAGRIVFQTNNGSSLATRMTLKSDGKLGINTSTPFSRFHVIDTTTSSIGTDVIGSILRTGGSGGARVVGVYGHARGSGGGGKSIGVAAVADYTNTPTDAIGLYAGYSSTPGALPTSLGASTAIWAVGNGSGAAAAVFQNGGIVAGYTSTTTTSPGVNSALTLSNGHLKSHQTTAPSLGTITGFTGGTPSLTNATDVKGIFSHTGSIANGGTATVVITYNLSYTGGSQPVVILTPANSGSATLRYAVTASSSTSFTITLNNNSGSSVSSVSFYYMVIE